MRRIATSRMIASAPPDTYSLMLVAYLSRSSFNDKRRVL